MRFRNLIVLMSMVLVCGFLTACGSGQAPGASALPAQVAQTMRPATGKVDSVVPEGVSVKAHPAGTGLQYNCASGFTSVKVPYESSTSYDGTAISFSEYTQNDEPHATLIPPDFNHGNYYGQERVFITFSGPLAFPRAVSAIVHTVDEVNMDTKTPEIINEDQGVIDLSGVTLTPAGIALETADFSPGGYITNVYLCMAN
jgi:hypothetical protein